MALCGGTAQNDNLTIHEDKARGVYVKGLTDVYVGGQAEVFAVMKAGAKSRVVSSTRKCLPKRFISHTWVTGARMVMTRD